MYLYPQNIQLKYVFSYEDKWLFTKRITIMRTTIFTLLVVLLSMQARAQDIPNGNFASWENRSIPTEFGGGTYARPTGGWDCLNSLAPGSCEKVEGRTAGSTAALLTTKKFTVNMGDGDETMYTSILMLGDFLTAFTEGEPTNGIPFKGQPTKFTFWYKYNPVSGDKGRVYINLWQGDRHNSTAKWRTTATFTEAVREWRKVEIDLTQSDDHGNLLNFTPTSLYIEATSSLTGMSNYTQDNDFSNVTQEGSQLFITDLAFDYASAENVYTVCGSSAIFGSGPEGWGWDTADTSNDMTPIGGNNYQLVKNNVALDAGTTYEYKVVQNHSWDVNWGIGGQDGKNFTFTVTKSDIYNVTFTFNLESGICTADPVSASTPYPISQVPNGNFAEWEERNLPTEMGGGSYTSPSGYWDTFNILVPGCVTKAEGRTAGSTAALLESKTVDMSVAGMSGEVFTTSLLVTDNFLSKMSGKDYEQGVPCKSIPARYLTFWYKYQPVGDDVAQVFIQFNEDLVIKKNVTRTVKFRKQITEAATDWTYGYIDLSVDENGNKSSNRGWDIEAFYIDITSSVSGMSSSTEGSGASAPGSKLWITELQFANEVTGIYRVLSDQTAAQGPIFNLNGQRVADGYKGIIIKNGKKVVVK